MVPLPSLARAFPTPFQTITLLWLRNHLSAFPVRLITLIVLNRFHPPPRQCNNIFEKYEHGLSTQHMRRAWIESYLSSAQLLLSLLNYLAIYPTSVLQRRAYPVPSLSVDKPVCRLGSLLSRKFSTPVFPTGCSHFGRSLPSARHDPLELASYPIPPSDVGGICGCLIRRCEA